MSKAHPPALGRLKRPPPAAVCRPTFVVNRADLRCATVADQPTLRSGGRLTIKPQLLSIVSSSGAMNDGPL